MASQGGLGGSPSTQQRAETGPPYAPINNALGGVPSLIPDIPITAVFLLLYVGFGVTHITIFFKNKRRGHKFVFSGAMFGFCKIRIITMSLRIAWACHSRNIGLAIAANVFVGVGTIILFMMNWFFAQRIVRAQHPRWGWSMVYRIIHRASLVFLFLSLFMLIIGSVHQFFTLDDNTRRIDRDLQLTGLTYFAAFSFAPAALVLVSLALPRKGTEKFGAGRLRNNITILLLTVAVLSTGTIFRCVTTWLPPVPIRNAQSGRPEPSPWYFSKTCFYVFSFTTEIIVVMLYALTRFDLRFHIPDGSSKAGDYREGRHHVDVIGKEKNLKRASIANILDSPANGSVETLRQYNASIFDDTRTLADSLRYPSSVLEVDSQTGNYKIKRISRGSATSLHTRHSQISAPSLWSADRDTFVNENMPSVPTIPGPQNWPLHDSSTPRGSIPLMEHSNRRSASAQGSHKTNGLSDHAMNGVDLGTAVADALSKVEANTEKRAPPPNYDTITSAHALGSRSSLLPKKEGLAPAMAHIAGSDLPGKSYPISPSPAPSSVDTRVNHIPPALPSNIMSGETTPSHTPASAEEFRKFSYEAPPRREDESYRE
ncbi:hypothetical protein BCR34DRAFT_599319 [Clohesyomyces aquaticus]|uniref:Uncharacterized protein n=1 Tax=Clohesyomyces aquaticus TaxID=1231657 RepID=A0A1Y1ZVX3_9PLEO|nr:hypothetical protein BCR34DRAFT_599319 [Clohesyomyces aquaticus]